MEYHTDEAHVEYYKDKIESIKNGHDEFVVRNFDSDLGRVYDFYGTRQDKVRWLGMVVNDYGFGCEVYDRKHQLLGVGLLLSKAKERIIEASHEILP